MVQAKFSKVGIIVEGEIDVSDIYPGACCTGFDWEVSDVFMFDDDTLTGSVWGHCDNPACPELNNRSYLSIDDLIEWLAREAETEAAQ